MPEMRRMATILTLSLLEARYDDAWRRWQWYLNKAADEAPETTDDK